MEQPTIDQFFETVEDPRHHNRLHKLIDIIVISICAVVSGADSYGQIELFAKNRKLWLSKFLDLPRGIPSHDTIGRVFERIDPKEFQRSFKLWIGSIAQQTRGQVIAIDGKTLRRSHDHAKDKKAIHMVSAWASANQVVLGQLKTEDKSNEITAIPYLLKLLDISGCIITIDAMGTQKKIARLIRERGGDYILALKENQGNLYKDCILFFEQMKAMRRKGYIFEEHTTVDGGHGRIETRKYFMTSDIEWLSDKEKWTDLQSIGMVESTREINGQVSTERRFFIASLPSDAKRFGDAVRSHWGIENRVHWILDIAFREDESRVRTGHAPENLAVLRHIALNLLKTDKSLRGSIKTKRLHAALNVQFLEKIVFS